jgi:hypothetical protein
LRNPLPANRLERLALSKTPIFASCLSRDRIGLDDKKRGVKIVVLQIQLLFSRGV